MIFLLSLSPNQPPFSSGFQPFLHVTHFFWSIDHTSSMLYACLPAVEAACHHRAPLLGRPLPTNSCRTRAILHHIGHASLLPSSLVVSSVSGLGVRRLVGGEEDEAEEEWSGRERADERIRVGDWNMSVFFSPFSITLICSYSLLQGPRPNHRMQPIQFTQLAIETWGFSLIFHRLVVRTVTSSSFVPASSTTRSRLLTLSPLETRLDPKRLLLEIWTATPLHPPN